MLSVQLGSVQFSYSIFVRAKSYNRVMTGALMHSNSAWTSQFSAGWWTVFIVSDVLLSSNGKLFHTDGPTAEKLCGMRPTVFVLNVAKSPALANCRCRRVAIAVTGVSSVVRYIAFFIYFTVKSVAVNTRLALSASWHCARRFCCKHLLLRCIY